MLLEHLQSMLLSRGAAMSAVDAVPNSGLHSLHRGLMYSSTALLSNSAAISGQTASSEMVRTGLGAPPRGVWWRQQGGLLDDRKNSILVNSFATNSHDIFNVHRDEPHNNEDTPFEFTAENLKRVEEICARYPDNWRQSAVIPVLDLAQQQNDGWLSLNAMRKVAEVLNMAEIRVFEVATFYTMFNRSKIGKYHVMVCGTTPCMLQGSKNIYGALKSHLGIDYGQTTEDGYFTLGEMECMGACVNAPMIAVADYTKGVEGFSYTYYEDLTPDDATRIVDELRAGKTPKAGSQYRSKAEPAGAVVDGSTWVSNEPHESSRTLMGPPPGPYCRDLDAATPPEA